MELITIRGEIRREIVRCRKLLENDPVKWNSRGFEWIVDTASLDIEAATIDDMMGAGNGCFSYRFDCRECGADIRDSTVNLVQIGDEPDYDSQTTTVCTNCLRKALALATGEDD